MASLEEQTLALVLKAERSRFDSARASVTAIVRERAPVDTGETRDSVRNDRTSTDGTEWVTEVVAATPQAVFTNSGTGLFGPNNRYITPVVAKALHWIDGGGDVFATRSAGSGKHKGWFTRAVTVSWPLRLQRSR